MTPATICWHQGCLGHPCDWELHNWGVWGSQMWELASAGWSLRYLCTSNKAQWDGVIVLPAAGHHCTLVAPSRESHIRSHHTFSFMCRAPQSHLAQLSIQEVIVIQYFSEEHCMYNPSIQQLSLPKMAWSAREKGCTLQQKLQVLNSLHISFSALCRIQLHSSQFFQASNQGGHTSICLCV